MSASYQKTFRYSYEKLIASIDARMAFFGDVGREEKAFCLRHDEDWDLEHSLQLARVEQRSDLRSVYFINHTCDYFDYSQGLIDRCRRLVDLGHEVGLHYNALETHLLTGEPVLDVLSRPLEFLRNGGIEIRGISAHGSKVCRDHKVLNFEIWKEFEGSHLAHMKESVLFDGQIDFERVPLSALDLEYDATLLDHAAYVSDSSARLWGMVRVERADYGRVYDLIEYAELMRGNAIVKSNVREVIDHFNRHVTRGMMHLLLHPRWWLLEGRGPATVTSEAPPGRRKARRVVEGLYRRAVARLRSGTG